MTLALSSWRCFLAFLLVDVVYVQWISVSWFSQCLTAAPTTTFLVLHHWSHGHAKKVPVWCRDKSGGIHLACTAMVSELNNSLQSQTTTWNSYGHHLGFRASTIASIQSTSQHMSQKSWLNEPTQTGSRTHDDASNSSQQTATNAGIIPVPHSEGFLPRHHRNPHLSFVLHHTN